MRGGGKRVGGFNRDFGLIKLLFTITHGRNKNSVVNFVGASLKILHYVDEEYIKHTARYMREYLKLVGTNYGAEAGIKFSSLP